MCSLFSDHRVKKTCILGLRDNIGVKLLALHEATEDLLHHQMFPRALLVQPVGPETGRRLGNHWQAPLGEQYHTLESVQLSVPNPI